MKNIVKVLLKKYAVILSYYYILKYKVGFSYKDIGIAISTIHGIVGYEVRFSFYRKTLSVCGDKLKVHYGAYIVYPDVQIGYRCTIEENSVVSLCAIGDDVIIAANVSIMSGGHHHETDNLNIKFYDSNLPLKRVMIGNNIWIGTHSVIMADIADGCILGAGSVLNKNAKEVNSIYAGVPAKLIRKRG